MDAKLCPCGKPADHVNADPDVDEGTWACLVPNFDRVTGERLPPVGRYAPVPPVPGEQQNAIDVAHLAHQRAWSYATFGPGTREAGVLDHIGKELIEIRDAETVEEKRKEWVDVIILALDGAWRSGMKPSEIIAAVKAKQARNEARTWPDWRTADPGKAIENDRSVSS